MSNFTHIPRHPRDGFGRHNNNPQPKYNVNRKRRYEQIGEGAVRTVYDRSDRNYKPRYSEHERGFSPRRVTESRVTRKGIFRNRKESFVVMKNLSSTVRRHVTEDIAAITAPDDSVEYVRRPYNELQIADSQEYYHRRIFQPRREEHSQQNEQTRPRSNADSQEYYHRRDHRIVREEHNHHKHRRPRSNAGSQEHHRRDQQPGREERSRHHDQRPSRSNYQQRRDDDCNSSRDSGQSSLPRHHEQSVGGSQESYHRRDQQPRREERSRHYEQKTPASPIFERRRDNDTKLSGDSGLASLVRALPSQSHSPHSRSANSRTSGSKYPAKLIRDRILFAVPRISLRDDDHDKYGATTQDLLHGSLSARRQGNHENQIGHCDLMNRTSVIDYNSDEPEPRYAAYDENIFQSELLNLSQQFLRPPTPEIERQFNQTIADEFRADENYLNQPPSPFQEADDFNANLLFDGSFRPSQQAQATAAVEDPPPSPGDAQLLKQLDELANPPFSQNFNMGSIF